jgi:hypothetical protein
MFKRLTGYVLAVIGFIGYGYFRNYKGSIIPLPTVWLFVSLGIGFLGLTLITLSKSNRISKQDQYNKKRLERLKLNGEKILLTLDNCEVKENNYYEEVENRGKAQSIDALYDPNVNYQQKHVEQSAIIYNYTKEGKKIRMTSQPFDCDADTLKIDIENKSVFLYVDRFDKNDYIFNIG